MIATIPKKIAINDRTMANLDDGSLFIITSLVYIFPV